MLATALAGDYDDDPDLEDENLEPESYEAERIASWAAAGFGEGQDPATMRAF